MTVNLPYRRCGLNARRLVAASTCVIADGHHKMWAPALLQLTRRTIRRAGGNHPNPRRRHGLVPDPNAPLDFGSQFDLKGPPCGRTTGIRRANSRARRAVQGRPQPCPPSAAQRQLTARAPRVAAPQCPTGTALNSCHFGPYFGSSNKPHCPAGGSHSSTLFPSGSMAHPNLPYSESCTSSRTLQPSDLSAAIGAWRSSTR